MQNDLIASIAPRLRRLSRGGYARVYRRGRREFSTDIHALVAEILDSAAISYTLNEPVVPGANLASDFSFGDTIVLIGKSLTAGEKRLIQRSGKKCIVISESDVRSDRFDSGIRTVKLGGRSESRLQTIFLDDPSFNFDYAHILPQTEKCSVMHGHTSSALVEIVGSPKDGMVVNFNDAKPIIRDAIGELDHKLFINKKYVVGRDKTHINLSFTTVHGDFSMRVPKRTTALIEGEATVENLAKELLSRIAPRMPSNVTAVGVYVYEGLNKGTHLLAQIHRTEAERRRRRQRRRTR